jgi:hypothetical protein
MGMRGREASCRIEVIERVAPAIEFLQNVPMLGWGGSSARREPGRQLVTGRCGLGFCRRVVLVRALPLFTEVADAEARILGAGAPEPAGHAVQRCAGPRGSGRGC